MVEKEGSRGYIIRETSRWRDMKRDLCGEVSWGYDGYKLKDLEISKRYSDFRALHGVHQFGWNQRSFCLIRRERPS
jgi:hypothetical protein